MGYLDNLRTRKPFYQQIKNFFICAVRSWNKLPHPLKTIKSATQLKKIEL